MSADRVLLFHPSRAETYAARLASRDAFDGAVIAASTPDEVECHIGDADILLASNAFPVEWLDRAGALRWIHVQGAGVNVWTTHGIPDGVRLSRTTGSFGPRMAQYALTYILVVAQSVREIVRSQEQRRWSDPTILPLQGLRLGVAGVGAIGQHVARVARAFDMRVSGLSRTQRPGVPLDAWYPPDRIEEFAAELDFLVIVLPLTPATRGLIGREVLEALPRHAWLVNMGRGPVVVETELQRALELRQIGGAVLDVFEREPLPSDHPFWRMDNVVVTPHCAGGTIFDEVLEVFLENLTRLRRDEPLINEVDLERRY